MTLDWEAKMATKPGILCWGGSNGWKHGNQLPSKAIDKWERDIGWQNQISILNIGLHHIEPGSKGMADQVKIARRIVEGGGEGQVRRGGTPERMKTRGGRC